MHFLSVNVTFYDAVNMINVVFAMHFHILLNSCLSMLQIIKLNKLDVERKIEYLHSVAAYQKYPTRLEEMIIFSPNSKIINSLNLVRYF